MTVSEADELSEIKERHELVIEHASTPRATPPVWGDIPFDYVYRLIADLSRPSESAAGMEVALLLQSQAGLRLGTGGTTDFSTPILYADANPAIARETTSAATEMLLAAWFYLAERRGLKDIDNAALADDTYRATLKSYLNLGDRIIPLLDNSPAPEDHALARTIQHSVDMLRRSIRKGRGH